MRDVSRLDEFLLPNEDTLRLMSDNIKSPTEEAELLRAVNWQVVSEFFYEDSDSPAHLAREMEQASSKQAQRWKH